MVRMSYYLNMSYRDLPTTGQLLKTTSRCWQSFRHPLDHSSFLVNEQLSSGELVIVIKTINYASWSQDAWFVTQIISRYGFGWVSSKDLSVI